MWKGPAGGQGGHGNPNREMMLAALETSIDILNDQSVATVCNSCCFLRDKG